MVMQLNIQEMDIPNTVKIALNMIVKNESKIIIRLLESVLPIVDSYCICDTGSTDDTKEIIKNFFDKWDISGCIIEEKFINFGYNRNYALQKCRELIDCDYILLLDADMKLEIGKTFNKNCLNGMDYFHILQGNDNFRYKNVRIIKNSKEFEYKGATHEYMHVPKIFNKYTTLDNNILFIADIGDGGCKKDKFIRDIRILESEVAKNPKDQRSYFYLANSYFDSKNYNQAIQAYKTRVELGGWNEEIFYSYYRIGKSYKALDNITSAIYYFLEAYNNHPGRAEPLNSLISIYRNSNKAELANLFYSQAITIPQPPADALFVESNVYNYLLHYEFYLFYFYLNENDRASYNIDTIQYIFIYLLNNHPYAISNILSNYKFYARILHCKGDAMRETSLQACIRLKIQPRTLINKNLYASSTPSISSLNDKIILNIRYVNYYLDDQWNYKYKESTEKTINICVQFSDNAFMKPKNSKRMENAPFSESDYEIIGKNSKIIEGVQDIRLLEFNNILYYTGVVLHEKEGKRYGNIHYGIYDISNAKLDGCLIKSPKNRVCEKNWLLFHNNKELMCIYEWFPLTIGKIKDNEYSILHKQDMTPLFKHIRGSTNGVIVCDEIWFVCHFVSYEKPRRYYHIIIKLDLNTLKFISHSIPFTFEGEPIEYCCGLRVDNDLLYMTYSIKDNNSNIAVLKKNTIKFMDEDLMY